MLHLRIVAPPDCTQPALDVLTAEPGVTNVIVLSGAARQPPGDVILCDVTREIAHQVLGALKRLDITERGSIAVEQVDAALSKVADDAEKAEPGSPADALVWEEVEARTSEESQLTWTYLAFLAIATMIAGIGVLLDQPILIVGAMVVGPEFGAVAALCVAAVRRQPALALRSARALVVGFPAAIAITVLATLVGRAVGLVEPSMLDADRPLTSFISSPDTFSFIVAFLAGIAGILSLTSAKSGALVGVLISVTTVPAAGNAGVALALGEPGAAGGSALQLTINLGSMICAGILTLLVQTGLWRRTRTRARAAVAGHGAS
jgi:uncharacterized hydrophobic protein (TIGR00271 family)